jgi:hypothetical protein
LVDCVSLLLRFKESSPSGSTAEIEVEIAMSDLVVIAIALAFTCLLLWFRSLLFKRRAGDPHRVYIMSHGHDDGDREDSNSADDWPSIIGAEEDSPVKVSALSADQRIGLAVMQDSMLQLLP